MGKSKYTEMKNKLNTNNNVRAMAQRNADLENTRDQLMQHLLEFKKILGKPTLIQNLTQPEKQAISKLMEDINSTAIDLSNKSLGEGALVMGTAALNSILLLHEEINQLKFHNFYLTKRVESLETSPKQKDEVKE
jgi:hypothetical protein